MLLSYLDAGQLPPYLWALWEPLINTSQAHVFNGRILIEIVDYRFATRYVPMNIKRKMVGVPAADYLQAESIRLAAKLKSMNDGSVPKSSEFLYIESMLIAATQPSLMLQNDVRMLQLMNVLNYNKNLHFAKKIDRCDAAGIVEDILNLIGDEYECIDSQSTSNNFIADRAKSIMSRRKTTSRAVKNSSKQSHDILADDVGNAMGHSSGNNLESLEEKNNCSILPVGALASEAALFFPHIGAVVVLVGIAVYLNGHVTLIFLRPSACEALYNDTDTMRVIIAPAFLASKQPVCQALPSVPLSRNTSVYERFTRECEMKSTQIQNQNDFLSAGSFLFHSKNALEATASNNLLFNPHSKHVHVFPPLHISMKPGLFKLPQGIVESAYASGKASHDLLSFASPTLPATTLTPEQRSESVDCAETILGKSVGLKLKLRSNRSNILIQSALLFEDAANQVSSANELVPAQWYVTMHNNDITIDGSTNFAAFPVGTTDDLLKIIRAYKQMEATGNLEVDVEFYPSKRTFSTNNSNDNLEDVLKNIMAS